jgi:hypothetical protein
MMRCVPKRETTVLQRSVPAEGNRYRRYCEGPRKLPGPFFCPPDRWLAERYRPARVFPLRYVRPQSWRAFSFFKYALNRRSSPLRSRRISRSNASL